MTAYRKKPVVIEATQWHNHGDHHMVEEYDPNKAGAHIKGPGPYGWVKTLEGGHIVSPGDWIITGVKGEHYPCKPDIFAATYTRVPETVTAADIDKIRGKMLITRTKGIVAMTDEEYAAESKKEVGCIKFNFKLLRDTPYSFFKMENPGWSEA